MKRLLDITLLTIFFLYFASNLLINIVAVPLAAYHSREVWKDSELISDSLQEQKKILKQKEKLKSKNETKK